MSTHTDARTQRYEQMFQTGQWFDHDLADFLSGTFPEMSEMTIYRNAGSLALAQRIGIMPEVPKNIFEFGSGVGEGLVALEMLVANNGRAHIVGSEKTPRDQHIADTMSSMFLGSVDEVVEDGYAHLEGSDEGSIDLIVANMFGPTWGDEFMIRRLAETGMSALSEGGVILINSDGNTMKVVRDFVDGEGINNIAMSANEEDGTMPEELPNGFIAQPHVFIIKV